MATITYPARSGEAVDSWVHDPAVLSHAIAIDGYMIMRPMGAGSGRDDSKGATSTPCLRVVGPFHYTFRIPVPSGDRTLTVKALQPRASEPRPRLVLLPNPEIDVTRQEAAAPAGPDWQAIGPVEFSPSEHGVVEVQLINDSRGWPCWFDDLVLT